MGKCAIMKLLGWAKALGPTDWRGMPPPLWFLNDKRYGLFKMTRMRVLLNKAKEENLVAPDMVNTDNSNAQG